MRSSDSRKVEDVVLRVHAANRHGSDLSQLTFGLRPVQMRVRTCVGLAPSRLAKLRTNINYLDGCTGVSHSVQCVFIYSVTERIHSRRDDDHCFAARNVFHRRGDINECVIQVCLRRIGYFRVEKELIEAIMRRREICELLSSVRMLPNGDFVVMSEFAEKQFRSVNYRTSRRFT